MLEKSPQNRISASDALNHLYLNTKTTDFEEIFPIFEENPPI